jgi:hypothetical protein
LGVLTRPPRRLIALLVQQRLLPPLILVDNFKS